MISFLLIVKDVVQEVAVGFYEVNGVEDFENEFFGQYFFVFETMGEEQFFAAQEFYFRVIFGKSLRGSFQGRAVDFGEVVSECLILNDFFEFGGIIIYFLAVLGELFSRRAPHTRAQKRLVTRLDLQIIVDAARMPTARPDGHAQVVFVGPLVLGKPNIAVDAEHAVFGLGIAQFFKCANLDQHIFGEFGEICFGGIVALAVFLKPVAVVVLG